MVEYMKQSFHGASVALRATDRRRSGHVGMSDDTALCGQKASYLALFSPFHFRHLVYPCKNCQRHIGSETTKDEGNK